MKDAPLRIYDYAVTKDWDLEKAAKYHGQIVNIISTMEKMGKPLVIEYVDDNLNVISTFKMKKDEKKFAEYEAKIEKLLKGELPE